MIDNESKEVNELLRYAENDGDRVSLYKRISQNDTLLRMVDRVGFNTVLNSYFKLEMHGEALGVVNTIKKAGIPLASDTINILLKNAFGLDSSGLSAEKIYDELYRSRTLNPDVRTLNIMMEGYRSIKAPIKVAQYYSYFSEFGLEPDFYTLSIRIRISTCTEECMHILENAEAVGSLEAPFLRCCIETLGDLGSPELAYNVAVKYLPEGQRINESSISGDSLLAAILNGKAQSLPNVPPNIGINDSSLSPSVLAMKLVLKSNLSIGPKGFCIILSHFQRFNQKNLYYGNELDRVTLNDFRDQLWKIVIQKKVIHSFNINGRVCDALLRSYADNVDEARMIWRKQLLPLAEEVKNCRGVKDYNEITEKSFEALMFVCGYSDRPDIALEISISVRKRNWSLMLREKLAFAFSRGKQVRIRKSGNFIGNILNDGLEKSVASELGVLIPNSNQNQPAYKGISKIRFKLK